MIGTLTQAYITVEWGGINLSAYDDGAGGLQVLAQNVQVRLNKGESAPECTFQISPNPIGFGLFQELKASALSTPFTVTIGYMNGSSFTNAFRFAGMDMTTGHDPKLEITGVSVLKGCWTDNKISYTMEEPIMLSEFPAFLQEKAGACAADLKPMFVGAAAQEAAAIEIKSNQTQRTPHTILMNTLRPHGMDLQVGDTAFGGELIIGYTPNMEGETAIDKPVPQDGTQPATPGQRMVYVIGPGLMENFNRKQTFKLGQTETKRAASTTNTQSNETEQVPVVQAGSAPQETAATQQTTTATKGKSNPSSAETGVVTPSGMDQAARQAFSTMLTSNCKCNVLMVPYMVGIKPRDIICVPSLAGPGSFIEDWGISAELRPELCRYQFYWIQGPAADYPLAG